MADPRERLEKEYGGALPPGLASLSEDDHAHLADAIDAARRRQKLALKDATDRGMEFVPRILRGAVRKVLFG